MIELEARTNGQQIHDDEPTAPRRRVQAERAFQPLLLGPAPQPYYVDPKPTKAHVAIFYRNFRERSSAANHHIGLGVNAMHTVKVLQTERVRCDGHSAGTVHDIAAVLAGQPSITHAIIEAPSWISAEKMMPLVRAFPSVHFTVRNHSQLGFLEVDGSGSRAIRAIIGLQESEPNLSLSANSERYCRWVEAVYQSRCLWLPNLYILDRVGRKPARRHEGRLLRVGSFGAVRALKNHATAAGAALALARLRGCDLELHVNTGREEHGAGVLDNIGVMFSGLPWARLVGVPWKPWPEFRRVVSYMDLCFQVSSTETFNLATADATAEGVASVVGPAIEWAPREWMGDIDDPVGLAEVGSRLLDDPGSAAAGLEALRAYLDRAVAVWKAWWSGGV